MTNPEPSDPIPPDPVSDATVRLPVGEPANPYSTQQLDLSRHLDPGSTLKLPVGDPEPDAQQTQKLVLPRPDGPPGRLPQAVLPPEEATQTLKLKLCPEPTRAIGWKVPLAVGALVVLGVAAYLVLFREPAPPPPSYDTTPAPAEAVPPAAQVYLDRAQAGDARAMHMLAVMYYNGLNLPKDREKGLYWYRKAAAQGSDAARAELSAIEGGR